MHVGVVRIQMTACVPSPISAGLSTPVGQYLHAQIALTCHVSLTLNHTERFVSLITTAQCGTTQRDQCAQPNELTECHLLCPHMYRHFLSRPRHCRQREIVPSRTTSSCGQRWNRCKSRCRRWPRPPWVKARSVTLYFRAQCSRVRVYFLCRCRGLNRRA